MSVFEPNHFHMDMVVEYEELQALRNCVATAQVSCVQT